jgi:hypothetical protein
MIFAMGSGVFLIFRKSIPGVGAGLVLSIGKNCIIINATSSTTRIFFISFYS